MTDILEQWAEALESGEYKQGRGALMRVSDGTTLHCCLGVLCELYRSSHPDSGWLDQSSSVKRFRVGNDDKESIPPYTVLDWAGLSRQQADVLAMINDNANEPTSSFTEIAKRIRETAKAAGGTD